MARWPGAAVRHVCFFDALACHALLRRNLDFGWPCSVPASCGLKGSGRQCPNAREAVDFSAGKFAIHDVPGGWNVDS